MTDEPCFCDPQKLFEKCCAPFLNGIAIVPSAEKLMRSRYSAYATLNTQYLVNTAHFTIRKNETPANIAHWARSNQWQKLEIIDTYSGLEDDASGTVEFKAYYISANGKQEVHHEKSSFVKEDGKWFYKSGVFDPQGKA